MSDNIPFEIQEEIMKRLPVKSLLQFRSVSKAWKSLIHSSDFITRYDTQLQHLLVSYEDDVNFEPKFVSIVDDDSFPQHKVCLTTLPPLVNMLQDPDIVGCSHGLLCLYGFYSDASFPGTYLAVIWNISIRRAVAVAVPDVADMFDTVVGFGVCGENSDPKIVKIRHIEGSRPMKSIPDCIPLQVEIFTLSTGAWRSPYSTNLPRTSIRFGYSKVTLDGFLYWLAIDWSSNNACNLIISFDMISEEFKEVKLPDLLAHDTNKYDLRISKLRNSLVVLEHDEDETVFVVWMMEDGVPKSFTKLFTIPAPDGTSQRVLEFRKSGEPVVEYVCDVFDSSTSLAVYDPYSKRFNNLEIAETCSYYVYAYVETLLLLDQPDCSIYEKGKRYTKRLRAKKRKSFKHRLVTLKLSRLHTWFKKARFRHA